MVRKSGLSSSISHHNRLPSVIIMHILSYGSLMVGSRDSFLAVNHQWYTCARTIKRPTIEWADHHHTTIIPTTRTNSHATGNNGNDNDDYDYDTTTRTGALHVFAVALRKYPEAKYAAGFINYPATALSSLCLYATTISQLESFSIRSDCDLYTIIWSEGGGEPRGDDISSSALTSLSHDSNLEPLFGQLSHSRVIRRVTLIGIDEQPMVVQIRMAVVTNTLLSAYRCVWVDDTVDDRSRDLIHGIQSSGYWTAKPSLPTVPVIMVNDRRAILCDRCNEWRWPIVCGVCQRNYCTRCQLDEFEYFVSCGT